MRKPSSAAPSMSGQRNKVIGGTSASSPTHVEFHGSRFFNLDAVTGSRAHVRDNSVDLIITDPPYGIDGDRLHQHYNRDERFVVDGYIEVPLAEYPAFTNAWVREAERVLRPGGSAYIVSGYTNLYAVLAALRETSLREVNHLIWKYNFGVFTKRKYVSSHYHILYYVKPGARHTFNLQSRHATNESTVDGGNANYRDREDVFVINREYKPAQEKNKNELPRELLKKLLQYSSNENDLVCDFFMGGCSTALVAVGMNRRFVGFEKSRKIFRSRVPQISYVRPGELLSALQMPRNGAHQIENAGKAWSDEDLELIRRRYASLASGGKRKGEIVRILCSELGRGSWSIQKVLKRIGPSSTTFDRTIAPKRFPSKQLLLVGDMDCP